jgi:surface polysaccharide O-acyltransferase-like enzyme
MQSPTVPTSSRMHWMDGFRGMAMLLVIVFHSVAMYKSLSGRDHAPVLDEITGFFNPYRMPLLLLLSGLLLQRALAKPLATYLRGKVQNILWPLVVWSVIQFVVTDRIGSMLDPGAWVDGTYQWFLVVLMACFMVAPLARWLPSWMLAVAFVALLLAVGPQAPELRRVFFYGTFFFLGAGLVRWLPRVQSAPAWSAGLAGLVGVGVGIGSSAELLAVSRSIPWTMVLPVPGLLALVWIGPRLPRLRLAEEIGRQSIVYYVTHTAVLLLIADLWRSLGWATPWWTVITLFVLAFGVPAFLARYRHRINILFELPLRSRVSHVPARARATVSVVRI